MGTWEVGHKDGNGSCEGNIAAVYNKKGGC